MAIKPITQIGEPVLRAKAKTVLPKDKLKVQRFIKDMIDSLHAADLIGIAAPQIGVGLQIFITEIRKTKYRNDQDISDLQIFINPKITWLSKKETTLDEGCGSLSSMLFGPVLRPAEVEVKALDENFKPFTLKAKGLLAKCIQHEYDHLQGTVVLDKFTDTRKCWIAEKK